MRGGMRDSPAPEERKTMDIRSFVPKGHRYAVSRTQLSLFTGMEDRAVRSSIAETSEKYEPIFHCEKGYFRYRDEDDLPYVRAYAAKEGSRNRKIAERLRKMHLFLKDVLPEEEKSGTWEEAGQMTLSEFMG